MYSEPAIVATLDTGGELLTIRPEAVAYGSAERLERLPAGGTCGGVDTDDLGDVMIDGAQHTRRTR